MKASNLLRVVASALVLSTLSFAAGVAGDLSLAEGPTHGTRVVLRIPPELPANTVRAAPLPLVSTAAAEARAAVQPVRAERIEARAKPPRQQSIPAPPKVDLDRAPKDENGKGA